MTMQQLSGAVQATAFAPRTVATRLSDINDQEREVQELVFPAAEYASQVKVTDEMVKAFYEKNAALFQIPEQVKAEYVLFTPEMVESQVSVTDAEIADFYAKNKARFATPEQRTASHILINAKKDAPAAEKAAAQAKAEADPRAKCARIRPTSPRSPRPNRRIPVRLNWAATSAWSRRAPSSSRSKTRSSSSSRARSAASCRRSTASTSSPSPRSSRPRMKTQEQAKDEIAAELKKQKMSKKYSELAEAFSNTLYEQSDSLKPAADKFKLKVETVDNLTRKPSPALGAAPFNNAKFLGRDLLG